MAIPRDRVIRSVSSPTHPAPQPRTSFTTTALVIPPQAENEVKYVEALHELQQAVHDGEGPELKDQMWDERYNWWIEQKKATGKYPDDFAQFYEAKNKGPEEESKEEAPDAKGGKDAKGKGGKDAKGKGGKDEAEDTRLMNTTLVGPTTIVTHMLECVTKYREVWVPLNESENHLQQHDEGVARAKLRPVVAEAIQKEVDLRLLEYLENIKTKVAERTAAGKGKKGKGDKKAKGGKKGGKKDKKGKKEKGGKKKKCCDGEKGCAGLTLQDMITVLVKMNILQRAPKAEARVEDLIGDINVLGTAYAAAGVAADPSLQQIRQCVTEYGVLPLGSQYVKENSPNINALLLYGPKGSGKTMLTNAIAAQTSATYFDMSPLNLEGKLGGKAEIAKLVHMVFATAFELQPAVIFLDDVDQVWLGGGKNKKTGPDIIKMKNNIMQHKAALTNDKRVLVVGNSRMPYHDKVDRKDLQKFFGFKNQGKMLFCPCPGYSTRLQLWKHFIEKTGMSVQGLDADPKFDLTTLAYISEGYSAGDIERAVNATLTERRVQKLQESDKGLDSGEFISAISKTNYTYKDEYKAFQEFTDDVTGEKDRRKLLALQAEAAASTGGDKKAAKKKK